MAGSHRIGPPIAVALAAGSATGRTRGRAAGARPPSTPSCTRPATPLNAASAGSGATVPSPPGTTSWPSATKPPSTSPRSANGSAPACL